MTFYLFACKFSTLHPQGGSQSTSQIFPEPYRQAAKEIRINSGEDQISLQKKSCISHSSCGPMQGILG